VTEQRYRAVLEVLAGVPVTEAARRYGVSRQSVHSWVGKYRSGGLAALADHSHRPRFQPRQLDADLGGGDLLLRRSFRRPRSTAALLVRGSLRHPLVLLVKGSARPARGCQGASS
jgi:transposase-like protein